MPRHFADVGSRLAFNFGIGFLALAAILVLARFGGSVTELVPLYTIGVFLAFTLSQSGLVRRWIRLRPAGWQLSVVINSVGALVTAVVLVVVAFTKFERGAWMVLVVLPLLVFFLHRVNVHYRQAQQALALREPVGALPPPRPPVVLVPVARIDRAAQQAIAFACSISTNVQAVHVATSAHSAEEFQHTWARWGSDVKLVVIESPYRSLVPPLLTYIDTIDRKDDRPITVVLTEFVPRSLWEWLLHSQTALRLKAALLFRPNTIVIDVPYHFRRAEPEGAGQPSR